MKKTFKLPKIVELEIGNLRNSSSGGRSGMGLCKNTYTIKKSKNKNK